MKKDVAYVAALNLSHASSGPHTLGSQPCISHEELGRAQREDPVISAVIKLKETHTHLTSHIRKGASAPVRRLLHKWGRL